MNIGLTGMPGTMKSTVGRELARLTGMELVDTDEVFEREEGDSISSTFERNGGGAPLSEENRAVIKRTCFCVRLTATPERIAERCCGNDTRPLLRGNTLERVKKLAAEREGCYADCACITIDTTDITPLEAAERIKTAYEHAVNR